MGSGWRPYCTRKKEFEHALQEMFGEHALELHVHPIVTHGKIAAVNGEMKDAEAGETYAFCNVYEFNGSKNPKIKKIVSYAIRN